MILDLLKETPTTAVPTIQILGICAMQEGVMRFELWVRNSCASVIAFEPQQAGVEKLGYAAQGTHRYLPYFLVRGRLATFHRTRDPGCSSTYVPVPERLTQVAFV